jgi:hypothetical protein
MDPRSLGSISVYAYVLVGVGAGLLWPRAHGRQGFSFTAAAIAIAVMFVLRVFSLSS